MLDFDRVSGMTTPIGITLLSLALGRRWVGTIGHGCHVKVSPAMSWTGQLEKWLLNLTRSVIVVSYVIKAVFHSEMPDLVVFGNIFVNNMKARDKP